jgi:hypothetical protein
VSANASSLGARTLRELAAALGAQDVEPFAAHKATTTGVRGRFARDGITPGEVRHARAKAGVHFLAAGHYATETFGARALGERFGVRHAFVDVPNPIGASGGPPT